MPSDPRIGRARRLRAEQTDAERRLWAILGGRRLGGFKCRRQVPINGYFADFVCLEAKLIVEADGSQHASNTVADARRTADLEIAGWRVVRFWNNDILQNTEGVAQAILDEIRASRR